MMMVPLLLLLIFFFFSLVQDIQSRIGMHASKASVKQTGKSRLLACKQPSGE